jgi:hypothetical protein
MTGNACRSTSRFAPQMVADVDGAAVCGSALGTWDSYPDNFDFTGLTGTEGTDDCTPY